MTSEMLKSWKVVKQHIPSIKFRKGGPFRENTPSSNGRLAGAPTPKQRGSVQQLPLIEDWELPRHYRRSPLSDKEIDAINSGGAP